LGVVNVLDYWIDCKIGVVAGASTSFAANEYAVNQTGLPNTYKIWGFSASASTLIIPIWFILGDLIAEVYGYETAKQVIWIAPFCQLLIALLCSFSVTLPSPSGWPHQEIYTEVFQKLPRLVFSSIFAILLGAFINAYIITRWKILLKGKYFLLRCLGHQQLVNLFSRLLRI